MITIRFFQDEEASVNFIHEVKANAVPRKDDTVCFWDTGSMKVFSVEQRFEWSAIENQYEECWYILVTAI